MKQSPIHSHIPALLLSNGRTWLNGILLVCCIWTPLTGQDITVRLDAFSPHKSMAELRGPAVLYLSFESGMLVDSRIAVPLRAVGGNTGTSRHFPLDGSGLVFDGSQLTGSATASVLPLGYSTPVSVSMTLNATVSGDRLSGNYTGMRAEGA